MKSVRSIGSRAHGGWLGRRLLACLLLTLASLPALAVNCSDAPYFGVIDGNVVAAPSQIQIDTNCTVRNYPGGMSTNFSFLTQPGQTQERWLIIFDNVVHTGQMACNAVAGHKIWFTNGSSTTIQEGCQNLLIPVEKIDKQNPAPTAAVGRPFTYRLTIPVLFDPATGTVINVAGSLDDLHGATIIDDLNATGADLTYISHTAYWLDSGAPVPHTFSDVGGVLTFSDFPIIPAGDQIILDVTVVLDDTPNNSLGTQFVNTAKWFFGRLIDGVFYEPLPGEWGVTPPMTIAAPELVVNKSGPATLNLGEWGQFIIDAQNIGQMDAWNMTLLDRLPDGPTGGMCDVNPEILSAQVFAADGVTPVPGKGPLTVGVDFTVNYLTAPTCLLRLNMLTAAAAVGPDQRLIIVYRTQLDASTQNGATLTNVAGATQWFDAAATDAGRQTYFRTLTDGTVGTADHQDAHTVTVALSGYFFEKTVANLTSGQNPTATASPGDVLRYTLRIQTTDQSLDNFSLYDELDFLNPTARFVPGTLTLVSALPGGAVDNSSAVGGAKGTGVIDIGNLGLGTFSQLIVQFDITLVQPLPNATLVNNQSQLLVGGSPFLLSDDPNINGSADPIVNGDEDPTRVQIVSLPQFRVQKVSTDLTADPNVLLAGETLRYTITVKNIGTDNAVDAFLRDQVPTNTSYVAGSTTLNGAPLADDAGGVSPLVDGIQLYAPENPTPGAMRADPSNTPDNVATITFDVMISPAVVDGTIISNQAFVSAAAAAIIDYPSDDPNTPIVNDPTRDIVGDLPLLFASKSVVLQVDQSSPGVVDPDDVLRYTIIVYNTGSAAATGVTLSDALPANTTYVADSVLLNGLPVGQPDGGTFPLIAGIDISSADLTPPLPGPGAGTLSAGNSATIQFDLRVNAGTAPGTVIGNQAVVRTAELPNLLTDGDGNPSTGPEPTVVVVGDSQQLTITKQVAVVGGGPAVAGARLEYLVRVTNVSSVPAFYVTITDDLDSPTAGQLTFVPQTATLNGSPANIVIAGSLLTADYSTVNGPLQPGESLQLRFRATLDSSLALGTTVTNTAMVHWNDPVQTASASVSVDVGGVVGAGSLNGTVWHDANFNRMGDTNERLLAGWTVELYRNSQLSHSVLTDAAGLWRISGVTPNYGTTDAYEVRFRAPGAGPNTAMLGMAYSSFTNALQRISDIVVQSGGNLLDLNLPIAPNGIVYNAMGRTPVAGATLQMLAVASGAALPSACFDDPVQQNQVTPTGGYYRFDLNFSDPACSAGGNYVIEVTAPGSGYVAGVSQIIPPASDASTGAFSVPACPGSVDDAVPATGEHCEAQPSEFPPALSVPARSAGTVYHLHLMLDDSLIPGSSQIFNNHIPLDPLLDSALAITKTTPLLNVTRGQMVPYTIVVRNVGDVTLQDVNVVDRFPAGFRYVEGSARLDGVAAEPVLAGRELTWSGLTVDTSSEHTLVLLLAVGAGVGEGEFVNRAQAILGLTGSMLSGEATATVRVMPDPTFDCSDVIGKVFDDANRNGVQDIGEAGLPGARVVTARGLAATTDAHGRFHITCAITPREGRGSNFVLKLDDRTLPSGFRASTDQVQVQRATRGKTLRVNFAASIHRVVGLDLADAVFEPQTTDMRLQWQPRVQRLIEELKKSPAVLRLSYLADVEDERLVQRRLNQLREQIMSAWNDADGGYPLTIEPQVFWRLGAPPKQAGERQ